ncbi:MAG: hypothetical protein ABI416_08070 [Ginsengibacter sp.]
MTLINDLFVVLEKRDSEMGFSTTIELNAGHIIYSGHFPGHPVTPGVIQMQMVQELLEKHLCRSVRLTTMSECKFLKILNPVDTPRIVIHIYLNLINEFVNSNAHGEYDAGIFFKMKSVYRFI